MMESRARSTRSGTPAMSRPSMVMLPALSSTMR